MSIASNKLSSGRASRFNKSTEFRNFVLGKVIKVGQIPIDNNGKPDRIKKDARFNSDTHCIRVRIEGRQYDNGTQTEELPNCFPILPKHLNFVPKIGEIVLVLVEGKRDINGDRYYIGPLISNELKFGGDFSDTTATANKLAGTSSPGEDINKIPTLKGAYGNPENVIINGRQNTDIIQRKSEILIRAGKFVENKPKEFNTLNPGYIQIKHNHIFNEKELNNFGVAEKNNVNETSNKKTKEVSVTNIVSNKINLLTHNNDNTYNITSAKENINGAAEYINSSEMDKILNNAHPLVFGDLLIEYLKLLKLAFLTHRHQINEVPAQPEGYPIVEFIKRSDELEKAMLSKNIRIN